MRQTKEKDRPLRIVPDPPPEPPYQPGHLPAQVHGYMSELAAFIQEAREKATSEYAVVEEHCAEEYCRKHEAMVKTMITLMHLPETVRLAMQKRAKAAWVLKRIDYADVEQPLGPSTLSGLRLTPDCLRYGSKMIFDACLILGLNPFINFWHRPDGRDAGHGICIPLSYDR